MESYRISQAPYLYRSLSDQDRVEIVRVLHGARDLEALFGA